MPHLAKLHLFRSVSFSLEKPVTSRLWMWVPLFLWLFLTGTATTLARPEPMATAYRVLVDKPGQNFARVEMTITGAEPRPNLEVAIPAWTPGSYEILNYSQYLTEIEAFGDDQKPCKVRWADKQTWRIETAGHKRLTVRYRVRCNRLAVDSNWLGPHFGQLQGAATFLYVVGAQTCPSTVEFVLPPDWGVSMPLAEPTPKKFVATDYESLIDAPIVVGEFVRLDFPVRGAKFTILTIRHSSDEKGLQQAVTKFGEAYADLMGGFPFDRYWFYFIPNEQRNGGGIFTEGLEHSCSTLINYAPTALIDKPTSIDFLIVTAHEFFHAWNVKRIRPKELVGASLAQEAYTPSLWFAEGVTDYYALLGLVRARLITVEDFANYLERTLENLENTEARRFVSLEDVSVSTWLTGTSNYQDVSVDYYGKGAVIGLLLDIEIRTRSGGAHSLDDVMRALAQRFPEKSAGYSREDLIAEVNRQAGADLTDFFRRYIQGTDALPCREAFEKIGFLLQSDAVQTTYQGYGVQEDAQGVHVSLVIPATPAAEAGFAVGDTILRVNAQTIHSMADLAEAGNSMKPAIPAKVRVKRKNEFKVLTLIPTGRTETQIFLELAPQLTQEQAQLRQAIFHLPATMIQRAALEAHVVWLAAAGFKPVVSLCEQG